MFYYYILIKAIITKKFFHLPLSSSSSPTLFPQNFHSRFLTGTTKPISLTHSPMTVVSDFSLTLHHYSCLSRLLYFLDLYMKIIGLDNYIVLGVWDTITNFIKPIMNQFVLRLQLGKLLRYLLWRWKKRFFQICRKSLVEFFGWSQEDIMFL